MRSKILLQTKEQLKDWAKEITRLKGTRKMDKRGDRQLWDIEMDIYRLKRKFRHHHIAMCELRGRTREQIEKPKECNRLFPEDERKISQIKQTITNEVIAEKERLTMYVIARKDVNHKTTPSVQASHAVAEYLLKHPRTDWGNGTMVVLSVRGEGELDVLCDKLDKERVKWVGFKEPDLDNETTAIAVISDNKEFFIDLDLLR